jgi:hypothetical protein
MIKPPKSARFSYSYLRYRRAIVALFDKYIHRLVGMIYGMVTDAEGDQRPIKVSVKCLHVTIYFSQAD